MQIAQTLLIYCWGSRYFKTSYGKEKKAELDKQKGSFNGAIKNGIKKDVANCFAKLNLCSI